MLVSLITNSVAMGIIFLYGCLGETITERVGNLNLGIPGIMCLGALGGVIGVDVTYLVFSNPGWFALMFNAILFSAFFAMIGGIIYAFLTVSLQANQNVTGLVLTTFGVGLMKFIGTNLNSPSLSNASKIMKTLFNVGDKLGWFGKIFLNYGFLVYFAIILAIFASIFIKKTRIGLFLRAVLLLFWCRYSPPKTALFWRLVRARCQTYQVLCQRRGSLCNQKTLLLNPALPRILLLPCSA